MKTKILIPYFLLATTVIFANNINCEVKEFIFIENIKKQNLFESKIVSILNNRGLNMDTSTKKFKSFSKNSNLSELSLRKLIGIEGLTEIDIYNFLANKALINKPFNFNSYSDLITLVQSKSIYISPENIDKISNISKG